MHHVHFSFIKRISRKEKKLITVVLIFQEFFSNHGQDLKTPLSDDIIKFKDLSYTKLKKKGCRN